MNPWPAFDLSFELAIWKRNIIFSDSPPEQALFVARTNMHVTPAELVSNQNILIGHASRSFKFLSRLRSEKLSFSPYLAIQAETRD